MNAAPLLAVVGQFATALGVSVICVRAALAHLMGTEVVGARAGAVVALGGLLATGASLLLT